MTLISNYSEIKSNDFTIEEKRIIAMYAKKPSLEIANKAALDLEKEGLAFQLKALFNEETVPFDVEVYAERLQNKAD